jgi:hypothetical protein
MTEMQRQSSHVHGFWSMKFQKFREAMSALQDAYTHTNIPVSISAALSNKWSAAVYNRQNRLHGPWPGGVCGTIVEAILQAMFGARTQWCFQPRELALVRTLSSRLLNLLLCVVSV